MSRIVLLVVLAIMAGGNALRAQNNTGSSKSVIVRQIKKVENMDSQWKNNADSVEQAGSQVEKLIQKGLKKTYDGNYKGLDTNYISLPEHPFLVMVSYNGQIFNHNIYTPSSSGTGSSRSSLNSDMVHRIGINASYRGAGLGFDFSVGGSKRKYLSLTYYQKRFGVELVSQSMDKVDASFRAADSNAPSQKFSNDYMDISAFKLHAFFVINNHRKFSYPAVLTYSTVQKRTAGGFYACATYFYSKTDDKMKSSSETSEDRTRFLTKSNHIAIGGGYGINLVPNQGKFVLHASANPVLLVSFNKTSDSRVGPVIRRDNTMPAASSNASSSSARYSKSKTSWNLSAQFRLAAVYNISERFVVGVNAYYDNFRSSGNDMYRASTTETTIYANFGVRF